MIDLIERMQAAAISCHRTLSLSALTPDIWAVPNFGSPKSERFTKLRINYVREAADLSITAREERLDLTVGAARAPRLAAAFAEVAAGLGDFGIATSDDKHADSWMFWWMPVAQRR